MIWDIQIIFIYIYNIVYIMGFGMISGYPMFKQTKTWLAYLSSKVNLCLVFQPHPETNRQREKGI